MLGLLGAAALGGYLLGSIPTAYLVVRWVTKGAVDIRRAGDGNAGANNVNRICGRRWAILVGALDIAKGVAAVLAFNLLSRLVSPALAGSPSGLPDPLAPASCLDSGRYAGRRRCHGRANLAGLAEISRRSRSGHGPGNYRRRAARRGADYGIPLCSSPDAYQKHHYRAAVHLSHLYGAGPGGFWRRLGSHWLLPGHLHRGGRGALLGSALPPAGGRNHPRLRIECARACRRIATYPSFLRKQEPRKASATGTLALFCTLWVPAFAEMTNKIQPE